MVWKSDKTGQPVSVMGLPLKGVNVKGFTFGNQTEKQTLPEKIEEKTELTKAGKQTERLLKTPFEIMDSDSRQKIMDLQKIPNQMKILRELADKIPEDPLAAMAWKFQAEKSPWVNKEQRQLVSGLNFAILDITKNLQGARPSDLDTKLIKDSINTMWQGRRSFKDSLEVVDKIVEKNMDSYAKSISKGYNIPEKEIKKLMGIDNASSTTNIKSKTIKLPSGKTITIKGE